MILFFFLFLFIFLANILLGCYVAIRFGFGPPTVRAALDMVIDVEFWSDRLDRLRQRLPALPFLRRPAPVEAEEDDAAMLSSADSRIMSSIIAPPKEGEEEKSFDEMMKALTEVDVSELLDDESDEITELAPMQEIFDEDLANLLMEQGTETWLVNEKHVETSILKLNVVMMKSGRFAAELDWRIRSSWEDLTNEDVKQFLGELKDDCRNYLDSQAEITQQMLERLDEFGELKYLAEEVDYANMEQSAQIETTLSNLDHLVLTGKPQEGATRLLKELGSLRIARHRLRDMQDRTFMQIVFYEDRVDTIPQQLYFDEHFGLRGRIGIEVALHEWWKQKRHQKRQITFALLDFVKFGEANDEHGIAVCDNAIKAFGRRLQEHFDATDLVGIFSGNCFLVATVNAGLQKTITEIERVRQNCEQTVFRYADGKKTMRLQLTCAITEALATQSREDVLKALGTTMTAAKKAGRNHTFQLVPGPLNSPPEKVSAPNMVEEPQEINLD